jgi:hypothetical protein
MLLLAMMLGCSLGLASAGRAFTQQEPQAGTIRPAPRATQTAYVVLAADGTMGVRNAGKWWQTWVIRPRDQKLPLHLAGSAPVAQLSTSLWGVCSNCPTAGLPNGSSAGALPHSCCAVLPCREPQ